MVSKKIKQEFIRVSVLAALLVFIGFLASQSLGLGASGFDSDFVLQQYTFYLSGAVFLIGTLLLIFTELAISKDDRKYGNGLAFNSPDSPPSLQLRFIKNPFGLFFLSIAVIGILMLAAVFTEQSSFTEFVTLEQQFNSTNQLVYSALLIPIAENLGLAFVIALTIFSIRFIARRVKMSRGAFVLTSIIFVITNSALYWVINHTLRYGDSERALIGVSIFGLVQGLFIILTGSFIPALILHVGNNITFSLIEVYSRATLLIPYLVVIITSFTIYLFILFTSNDVTSRIGRRLRIRRRR